MNTLYRFKYIVPKWARLLIPPVRKRYELIQYNVEARAFKNQQEPNPDHFKQIFLDHIEDVKTHVPDDQLLVFEVAEGWEPLCDFLDVPVPDEPFPRLNDTASMRRMQNIMQAVFTAIPILVVGGVAYGIYATVI